MRRGEPADPRDRDPQAGTKHPWLTDPMTQPLPATKERCEARMVPARDRRRPRDVPLLAAAGGDGLPLVDLRAGLGDVVADRARPARRASTTAWRGWSRCEMLSALKDGYQVMLNNGFGPDGSRQGVVSYSTGFREPGHEIVDFSGDKNRQVVFQSPKPPRRGYGYHPNHDCLQASPLIFYDWGTGSLTIAARSLVLPLRQQLVELRRAGGRRRVAQPGVGPGGRRQAHGGGYGRVPLHGRHGPAAAAAVPQRPLRGLRRRVAPHGRAVRIGRGGDGSIRTRR